MLQKDTAFAEWAGVDTSAKANKTAATQEELQPTKNRNNTGRIDYSKPHYSNQNY